MVSATPLNAGMWPGLLTLKFPTGEGALSASLEGRSNVYRGSDPVSGNAPVAEEPGGNNPLIPDFIENPIEAKLSGIMKNGLIAVTGIIILAIGLLALVLQTRGGSLAS